MATIILSKHYVVFIGFPFFMHGIGRHEGNWSLKNLETALINNTILLDKNPVIEHTENKEHSECQ